MSAAIELLDKRSLTRVFDETVPDYLTPTEAIAMIDAARMQNRRDELFLKLLWVAREQMQLIRILRTFGTDVLALRARSAK